MDDPLLFTPGPTKLPYRVLRSMLKPMIFHRSTDFHEVYKEVIEKLHKILFTDKNIYILTTSGTGGIEAVIANLIKPHDKVLVPVYGIFSQRIVETILAYGGDPIVIEYDGKRGPSVEDLKKIFEKEREIKATFLVYNDTCPGILLNNFEKLAKVIKDNNSLLFVDAISISGGINIPIDQYNIDVLVTATQKCLATPPGLSIVVIDEDLLKMIDKGSIRTFYLNLLKYRDFALKYETPFTPAVSLIYALNEALNMILDIGFERWIRAHEIRANALYSALTKMELEPYVIDEFRSTTIISLDISKDEKLASLPIRLRQEYNIFISGGIGKFKGKIIRIGNMGALGKRDVISLLSCIGIILLKLGYEIDLGDVLLRACEHLKYLKLPLDI